MPSLRVLAIAAAFALLLAGQPARADGIDLATYTCGQLEESNARGSQDSAKGIAAILYWMAGYHATEAHGTVVDFEQLLAGFDKVLAHCKDNPSDIVLTVSGQHFGVEEPGASATDLALLTCEKAVKTPEHQADALGQILMWMAGYQAGFADDAVLDLEAFRENSREIGEYCAANPQISLYAASEKFMAPAQ